MKKYRSLSAAISLILQACVVIGLPTLYIILAYLNGYSDNPFWLIGFIPLALIALGYILGAFYNLQKIVITENHIKSSLFGFLFVKEFNINSIVDVKAIYYQPTNKRPKPLIKVIFSQIPIPDFITPKSEKLDCKKSQIKFLFNENDIVALKGLLPVPIREDKLLQRGNKFEIVQHTDAVERARKITITREKKFWACSVPFYFLIDGKVVATAKNGETISFQIDNNQHELFMSIHAPQNSTRSNIVIINADNIDKTFILKMKPNLWTGVGEFMLTQITKDTE